MSRWCRFLLFLVFIVQTTDINASTDVPPPIRFPTDGARWYGNDGSWSSLTLRLGTPAQYIYILVSTASSETWSINPKGCNDAYSGYTCVARGEPFDTSASSTWRDLGQYSLDLRPELSSLSPPALSTIVKDYGYGDYGLDTIKFKSQNSPGEEYTLENQVVAVINDTTYLTGMLGLGLQNKSFEQHGETTHASLLATLHDRELVPSRSYGFTAGAYHRPEQPPMDLVLGGTNLGRYNLSSHNTTFTLDANQNPVISLSGLSVQATGNAPWGLGAEKLLATPTTVQIDSSQPYLYLPLEVCRNLETTLGLAWDDASDLYLLNDSLSETLTASNLTFTFTLADVSGNGGEVEIKLPYAALELEVGYPFLNITGTRKYFPVKRAEEEGQYTLGRAFLTEAYLAVDYELGNFSVYQATYPPSPDVVHAILNSGLVNISSGPGSGAGSNSTGGVITGSKTNKKKEISAGAIAGIAVGGAAVLVACVVLGWAWYKKRVAARAMLRNIRTGKDKEEINENLGELPGAGQLKPLSEMSGDTQIYEMPATKYDPSELPGCPGPPPKPKRKRRFR